MKIATIGRGNIGGGLAKRWRATGHDVTEFGSDGGNATGSDAVLVAIPSNAIENAFTKVAGIERRGRDRRDERVHRPRRGLRLARAPGQVARERSCSKIVQLQLRGALRRDRHRSALRPAASTRPRTARSRSTELLIRDAGYHPVSAGGLGSARMLEDHLALMTAISEGGLGRFFYRYATPGEL